LINGGVQVPVIPLFEIPGSAGTTAPLQIGLTFENIGNTLGFTVIVKVVGVAHCPAVGVNV